MNRSNLASWLRMLVAEPPNDVLDPRPPIRRGLMVRAGAAAVLVSGLAVGVAIFGNQAQTASADEAVQQLQVEAGSTAPGYGPCGPANANPPAGAGVIAIADGGAGDPDKPVTVNAPDPAQLSDKLAQALGVSSDRVREAMLQTLKGQLPSGPPPDPLAGIAQQLGVSKEQVCAAFSNPQAIGAMGLHTTTGGRAGRSAVLVINGTEINLDTGSADQLSRPAQKLGVTTDRLLAAIKASFPEPPQPPSGPPNADDIINRFAQNLGMSPDKVRAAFSQVEGTDRFYFAVPLPNQ